MSKLNISKTVSFVFVLLLLVLPLFFISAAPLGCNDTTINNPLGCNKTEVKYVLINIMNIVALIGGIVVVFFIIYSGFKFVMAKGNPGELEKAKDMFFATVIGGAILLGADIIANVVVNTVNTIKN